jgi:hypothetical protein
VSRAASDARYNAKRRALAALKPRVSVLDRTAAWRRKNEALISQVLAEVEGDDSAYLAERVCRDFRDIMLGYADVSRGVRARERFSTFPIHNIYWS